MGRRPRGADERLFIDDFSGGVNLLESPHTLPAPFLPAGCLNVTLRGRSLCTRFGTKLAGTLSNASKYIFFSPKFDLFFAYETAAGTLAKYTISGTNQALAGRTAVKTFTTNGDIQIVEFAGLLVLVHAVDGVFTSTDGTTWTNRSTTVKGTIINTWQNKCWVAGDSSNPSRVWWCNAGDATTWTTATDFVDIREVNDRSVSALGVAGGMDVVGRGGLLVFKNESAYRIYSSATGAYTTIDAGRGAGGALAVTAAQGYVYCANQWGVYRMDGDKVTTISDPVRPGWETGRETSGPVLAWSAWDRVYFSNTAGDAAARKLHWELIPERGAWFPHGFNTAAGSYTQPLSVARYGRGASTTNPLNTSLLLLADGVSVVVAPNHPSGISNSTATPAIGTDNGNAVDFRFSLPVVHKQLQRFGVRDIRVLGWGAGVVTARFAGLMESPRGASGTSSLTPLAILAAGRNWPPFVPVNIGSFTSMRAVLEGTFNALANASETQANAGNLYSPIASDLRLPAYAIEAISVGIAPLG